MGVLWFDADGDGDMDLYVVSGGVECEPADPVLGDRLYLNDGTGAFHRAPAGTLPNLADSGSVVTAGDLDGDGDLDLFVGGRVIPGKYPLTPNSRLLRNDRGRFQDVTDELAPGLRHVGLVTGAVWSDADNDGRLDLLVTQEWGPVKFFHNTGGALLDRTYQSGLDEHSGWWNGIAAGDFDGDSDIDYVVTNFGLNTKYVAHRTRPARLYCKDFDASGTLDLVEAMFEDHDLFPVRGRSCSSNAMPFVAEKFTTYHDFGLANLGEVYTEDALASAKLFEATQLQSGVLINQGGGTFEFHPLPRIAQASPGFGALVTDFDADGKPDIYFVQNFFSPQPETGRMDGGLSLLLRGNGDGTFTPVTPSASGLLVPQDAMALTLCDLDNDGRPDAVVSVNDGDLRVFRNSGNAGRNMFVVRLLGKPGNPTAVGARVTVVSLDGAVQTAEVHAGSGYLSQSTADLFFGLGEETRPGEVRVRWPNGARTTVTPEALTSNRLTISQP